MGATVDGAEPYGGPLVAAAAKGDSNILEFLIQHGATVDRSDGLGQTALETAVRMNELVSVQTLLKNGANPNKVVGAGTTIIDLVKGSTDPTSQLITQALSAGGGKSEAPLPQ